MPRRKTTPVEEKPYEIKKLPPPSSGYYRRIERQLKQQRLPWLGKRPSEQ